MKSGQWNSLRLRPCANSTGGYAKCWMEKVRPQFPNKVWVWGDEAASASQKSSRPLERKMRDNVGTPPLFMSIVEYSDVTPMTHPPDWSDCPPRRIDKGSLAAKRS